jgi:hypothetical protein
MDGPEPAATAAAWLAEKAPLRDRRRSGAAGSCHQRCQSPHEVQRRHHQWVVPLRRALASRRHRSVGVRCPVSVGVRSVSTMRVPVGDVSADRGSLPPPRWHSLQRAAAIQERVIFLTRDSTPRGAAGSSTRPWPRACAHVAPERPHRISASARHPDGSWSPQGAMGRASARPAALCPPTAGTGHRSGEGVRTTLQPRGKPSRGQPARARARACTAREAPKSLASDVFMTAVCPLYDGFVKNTGHLHHDQLRA